MHEEEYERTIRHARQMHNLDKQREEMRSRGMRYMQALVDSRADTHERAMSYLATEFAKRGRSLKATPPTESEYLAAIDRVNAESESEPSVAEGDPVTVLSDVQLVELHRVAPD